MKIIHVSAGTWFQCSLFSHPGKTFFTKHLGDEFLWPVNYDKGVGEGYILQNITSEMLFFFSFNFMCFFLMKRPMEKLKLFYFCRAFRNCVNFSRQCYIMWRKEFKVLCHRTGTSRMSAERPCLPLPPWLSYAPWLTSNLYYTIYVDHFCTGNWRRRMTSTKDLLLLYQLFFY